MSISQTQRQRQSRSLSPMPSPRLTVSRRPSSRERVPPRKNMKRTHEEPFFDHDDDDWIFNSDLREVLTQVGGGTGSSSNEEFAPDDTLSMETTFIRVPGPGSGNDKRYKPSCAAVQGIVKSPVTINNCNNLCCARAIVTMKTRVDGGSRDTDYRNMQFGLPVQTPRAKGLHRLAGVPKGPCGIPKLQQLQTALPGYQLKVMSIVPPHMIIYAAPTLSDKIIRLIKEGEHYDGCSSLEGLLSTCYFCDECNRGYSTNDI